MKYLSCAFGLVKLYIFKIFHINKVYGVGKQVIYPSVMLQVGKRSKLILHKNVSIRRETEINVRDDAIVEIGENSFLNSNCIITAHEKIIIGNNVEFGPGVMVFDHDHKFSDGYKNREFNTDEIVIGNNVWIGAGSIILRGTHIGDNCVIAAGSIIKGNYPPETLVYQKRNTIISSI